MNIVNFPILKTPTNWLIVILTIVIGGFALHVLLPSPPENS